MNRLRILFSHWQIVVMALGFAAGLAAVLAGPRWLLALVPMGVAAQMLNEYAMHRFLFHWPPPRRQWQFDLLWQAHYGHHDFPTNHRLFFVPWWVALPMLAVHFTAVALIGGWLAPGHGLQVAAAMTLTGGVGTFLCYEWFHMTTHLPVAKTAIERRVATLHNQHHFRDVSRWFHVSPGGEVIDRALGTALGREALKARRRAEFIRTLGLRPDDPRLVAARRRFAARYGLSEAEITRAAR